MKETRLLLRIALFLSTSVVVAFVVAPKNSFSSAPTTSSCPHHYRQATFCASTRLTATPITKQQEFDTDHQDSDDDFYEPCEKSFTVFEEELQALAFLSSDGDTTAASKAQEVFDSMYEAHVVDDNPSLWPNVNIYNLLIDAHAWSSSKSGGKDSQLILDRMSDASVEGIARPNVDTYIKVMEAWASRKQPQRAQQVFEELQNNNDVQANTGAFNKLIKAWMKSGSSQAPAKAEDLLQTMMQQYNDGNKLVKPNRKTWIQVMNCYQDTTVESVEKISSLLQQMSKWFRMTGDEACQPNTQCYNVLIKATGHIPALTNQVEEILYEMLDSYENGNIALKPNGATFCNVYNAFRNSNDADAAADTVCKILQLQQELSRNDDFSDCNPDVRSYNAVLSVVARANDPNKTTRCKEILDQIKTLRNEGRNKRAGPNLRTYNNILNACAYTKGEPKQLMAAFRVAVDCINDLRESPHLQPDPVSYGLFLRSCRELMPPSDKREAVVENIFRKCCTDGQVGKFVLYELDQAASQRLCRKLLGGDMDQGVELPSEWSRNVKNAKQKLR